MNSSQRALSGILIAGILSSIFGSGNLASATTDPAIAQLRALQGGVIIDTTDPGTLGTDIQCVGAISIDSPATDMDCYLIPPNTPIHPANAVAVQSDDDGIAPICGEGNEAKCFVSTFDSSLFTESGEWHFIGIFRNVLGLQVDLVGVNFRIHSFFVIPESPIGVAALVGSSFAALGGFFFLRHRKNTNINSEMF